MRGNAGVMGGDAAVMGGNAGVMGGGAGFGFRFFLGFVFFLPPITHPLPRITTHYQKSKHYRIKPDPQEAV
jgi:hypothetical protein